MSLTIAEKLDRYVEHDAVGGCLLWARQLNEHGYGILCLGKNSKMLAHRASYENRHGPLKEGVCVLHRCDVPACVNPEHLFTGSRAENMADMYAKGRWGGSNWPKRRGEETPWSQLTEVAVIAIRQAVAGGARLKDLAAQYGVKRQTIGAAAYGVTWTDLPGAIEPKRRNAPCLS